MVDIVAADPNAPNPQGIELPIMEMPEEQAAVPNEPLRIVVRPTDAKAKQETDQRTFRSDEEIASEATQQQAQPKPDVWGKVGKAIKQGISRDDAAEYLAGQLQISVEEADAELVQSVQKRIKAARATGVYTDEQITQEMAKQKFDPSLVEAAMKGAHIDQKWQQYDYNPNVRVEEAAELEGLYSNIYSKYSTALKEFQGIWDEDKGRAARTEINGLNAAISAKLNERGYQTYIHPTNGDIMMKNEQGQEQEVDSGFVRGLLNSKSELTGAVAGGTLGAAVGGQVGGRIGGTLGAVAGSMIMPGFGTAAGGIAGTGMGKTIGAGIGGIIGGSAGAAGGRGLDMAYNALALKEQIEVKVYLTQMKEAGILDATAGIIGVTAFKTVKSGYRGIIKAYKLVTSGNTKGAYKALLENLNVTDDQAQEMVRTYEAINAKKAVGANKEQKAISVLTTTMQGGEIPVAKAAAQDPKLYRSVITDIDERAKGVMRAADSVADENVGQLVRNNLKEYQSDVKKFYGEVRDQGSSAVDGTDFRFNLEKLAIKPVLDNIKKSISNPAVRERFVSLAERVEAASGDRTFSGLVDLRQVVNDFKYSKLKLNKKDLNALNTVLNRIDGDIGAAAKKYVPNHKDWLANFNKAKVEYAKMKQLEVNALYKLITRKGATEQTIQSALSKYGKNNDVNMEVYNAITERLSGATLAKVEGAAIKSLVTKNTFGGTTDFQATHFPALVEDLKQLAVTTPEAKAVVNAVTEIAKVFKNDAVLSGLSAGTPSAKIQSAMSASLLAKAKYSVMQQLWNSMQRLVPSQGHNNLALVGQVSKLLENPMHSKTAEDFIRGMPKPSQADMRSLVKELQIQTAKAGLKPKSQVEKDWLHMYKQSSSGKMTASDGALGKGIYLFDKIANPTSDMKVIRHEVNLSRMATIDDISTLVGRQVDVKELRNIKDLNQQLADKGFLGIRVEGKAMLFPETTLGVKAPKSVPKASSVSKGTQQAEQLNLSADKNFIDVDTSTYHGGRAVIKASDMEAGESGRAYFSNDKKTAGDYAYDKDGNSTGIINEYRLKGKFLNVNGPAFIDFVKKTFNNKLPDDADTWEDLAFEVSVSSDRIREAGKNLSHKEAENLVNNFIKSQKAIGIADERGVELSVLGEHIKKSLTDKGK